MPKFEMRLRVSGRCRGLWLHQIPALGDGRRSARQLAFLQTPIGVLNIKMTPGPESERGGSATALSEATGLILPGNSDSSKQQEILDALPVLVFLEQAGQIVFANSEARRMLGLTEGEWLPRPVEDVL